MKWAGEKFSPYPTSDFSTKKKDLNPHVLDQGRFGPIPVWPGRLGPCRFCPISWVSSFGPFWVGCFGPMSKVGRFGLIFGVSRFGPDYFGKTSKILG